MSERNPYRQIENGLRKFGDIALVFICGGIGVTLLIVVPILGFVFGLTILQTWLGWFILGGFVIAFLVVWGIMSLSDFIKQKWYAASRKWEREHSE